MSYLTYYEEIDGGYVAFGGNHKGGKITGKGTIKTGKFDGKADEGFFVGYSLNSKAFRVFNSRTTIVEENVHIKFSESTPNVVDDGFKPLSNDGKKVNEDLSKRSECKGQEKQDNVNITNNVNNVSSTINIANKNDHNELLFDPNMPALEDVGTFYFSNKDEDDDVVADINNLDATIQPKRKNTQVPQPSCSTKHVADEVVYKELDDRLVRAATTTSSLEA
nr:retrovirus-related Pol polyprotein from transposon TNT 1-94 [Tanacetum cinerariifolium]